MRYGGVPGTAVRHDEYMFSGQWSRGSTNPIPNHVPIATSGNAIDNHKISLSSHNHPSARKQFKKTASTDQTFSLIHDNSHHT